MLYYLALAQFYGLNKNKILNFSKHRIPEISYFFRFNKF